MIRSALPLSPQHTGGSIPSTISHATNTTWVSSMTSYPPSAGGDENRGRSGWRSGKERVSPRESRVERPAMSKKSSSGHSIPLSDLSKRPSNSSLITPPLSSNYSNFDIMSPPTLHRKDKSSSFSQSKVKIKPLLRKISSQEHTTVDLSRSVAENEGLGIFTNSSNSGVVNHRRGYHTRTSSGVSQVSTNTTSSNRAGAQYVHPMRQTPQSFTPTLAHSRSRAGSIDDHSSYPQSPTGAQSYAPIPSTTRRTPPPPLHVRTYSNNSRTNSTSQLNLNTSANVPGTPSSLRQTSSHSHFNHHHQPSAHSATTAEPFSPETMPLTARSSLESAFGRKRSRGNTATTPTDDPVATVQALRAEFYAREAAKEAKYAEAAQRAAEKEARRQERREASQRRKDEAAERKRVARANTGYGYEYEYENEKAGEEDVPLSAIEYSNTVPAGLPVDEELEWIRKGIRPPTQKQRVQRTQTGGSSVGKKAKAVSNGWGLFWFRFKTVWLKFKRGMGIKSG